MWERGQLVKCHCDEGQADVRNHIVEKHYCVRNG